MFIQQLSVFVENRPGRLADVLEVLAAEDFDYSVAPEEHRIIRRGYDGLWNPAPYFVGSRQGRKGSEGKRVYREVYRSPRRGCT